MVFRTDINSLVDSYFEQIVQSISTNFLYKDRDIWTEADDSSADNNDDDEHKAPQFNAQSLFSDMESASMSDDELQWGADPDLCVVGNFAVYKCSWDDGDVRDISRQNTQAKCTESVPQQS